MEEPSKKINHGSSSRDAQLYLVGIVSAEIQPLIDFLLSSENSLAFNPFSAANHNDRSTLCLPAFECVRLTLLHWHQLYKWHTSTMHRSKDNEKLLCSQRSAFRYTSQCRLTSKMPAIANNGNLFGFSSLMSSRIFSALISGYCFSFRNGSVS
jgi:hypothetical protein